jgi:hypothetical protein
VATNQTGTLGNVNATAGAVYDTANRKKTWSFTFASSTVVSTSIRQAHIGRQDGTLVFTFEERQRKDDGFQLVITFTLSWEPALD